MTDDWNLKGKGIDTWYSKKKKGTHWKTYLDKDIETLRKKLIEDLAKIGIETTDIPSVINKCLISINKRFGVKE